MIRFLNTALLLVCFASPALAGNKEDAIAAYNASYLARGQAMLAKTAAVGEYAYAHAYYHNVWKQANGANAQIEADLQLALGMWMDGDTKINEGDAFSDQGAMYMQMGNMCNQMGMTGMAEEYWGMAIPKFNSATASFNFAKAYYEGCGALSGLILLDMDAPEVDW